MAIVSGGTGNNTYSWTSNPVGFTATIYNPIASPVVSTTYIVAVNDGFTNTTDSVFVTVLPMPGIPETPTGPDTVDLYTIVHSEYYTNGGASASSYFWELNPLNAGTISGTGTTGTVVWTADFLGTALIGVKSVNSCGESLGSIEKQTIVENTVTGIDQNQHQFAVLIYPNPATNLLTIEFPAYTANLIAFLDFVEIRGQLVKRVSVNKRKTQVDISTFPPGVYMIKLTVGNDFRMIKFVKTQN
jgi:hypothetical protein